MILTVRTCDPWLTPINDSKISIKAVLIFSNWYTRLKLSWETICLNRIVTGFIICWRNSKACCSSNADAHKVNARYKPRFAICGSAPGSRFDWRFTKFHKPSDFATKFPLK